MTYKEKVDWLLGYRRQQSKVEELNQEMQEMQAFWEQQREQVSEGRGDWLRTRQEHEAAAMQERKLVIAKEQRRLAAMGDAVDAAIKRLEEPRQRRVLRQIYLMGMSQNQVCEQFHYCKRQVSRTHADGVTALELRPEDLQTGQRV